jgi:hypothetical protein
VDLLAAHAVVDAVRLGDVVPAPAQRSDRRRRRGHEKERSDRDGRAEHDAHRHSVPDVRDNVGVAEVDRLYELPLEEFTAARNELAKRLGDESIKQLKKPTVPAWTVNQLARRREVDVRRLLRAGEQLEQAQRQAVEGGDQQAYARARNDERDALRRLRAQAADVLRDGGHPATDATLERVARTLHAGAATEEGRALLRDGNLSEELEPQGFGALAGVKPAAPRAKGKKDAKAPDRSRARKARAEADAAQGEADAAASAMRDAEQELARLRRTAERAAAKADRLRAKADELER